MTECLTEYGKCMIESGAKDGKNVNICDAEKVIDMIKDLCEAENCARLAKRLERDEEGCAETELRTADCHKDTMRYTEMQKVRENPIESEYERSKREHWETVRKHSAGTPEDKQATMRSAETVLNIVFDDVDRMMDVASPELKNLIKARVMSRMQCYN